MQEIAKALVAAQQEMGKVVKDANNPFFNSKYADLKSVMGACMPALHKNGIAVIQPQVYIDGEDFVKTIFIHTSGETVETAVRLIVDKNNMQGMGSATTYARRYGLLELAGLAPEDDDGNAASAAPPKQRQQRKSAPQSAAPTSPPSAAMDMVIPEGTHVGKTIADLTRAQRTILANQYKRDGIHPDFVDALLSVDA
jgi:hypothetical protein